MTDRASMVRAPRGARVSQRRAKPKPRPRVGPLVPAAGSTGRLRGKGAYSYSNPGPWGKIGRYVGSAVGGAYGGPGGAKLGGALGGLAHYVGRIFGSGDYVMSPNPVKYNILVNESQVPQFGSMPNQVHVRHREYLGDIVTSGTIGAFRIQNFPINPGMAISFPWLSQVCGATFQQYRVNGMVFEYRTMSSDSLNSTNTALGSVIMATEYDSTDTVFTNKAEMENTEFGVSCKPSCNMMHAIECDRRQTSVSEMYVRNSAPPANADIRMYDLGRFSIATVGFQAANVNIGELWCTYDITLFKAVLEPPLALGLMARIIPDVATGLAGGIGSHPIIPRLQSATPPGFQYDNIGLTIDATGHILTFPLTVPNGTTFIVVYQVKGANNVAATFPPALVAAGGLVDLNFFGDAAPNDVPGFPWPLPGPGAAICGRVHIMRYNGTGTPGVPPTLTWADFVAPTTPTAADLLILQVPSVSPL